MTEALVPAAAALETDALTGTEPTLAVTAASSAAIVLPQMIVDAGPAAAERFLEFFAGRIASGGAKPEASGSKRSRRSTSRPTSGPTPARPRRSSSTSRPSACSATGSSSTRFSR